MQFIWRVEGRKATLAPLHSSSIDKVHAYDGIGKPQSCKIAVDG